MTKWKMPPVSKIYEALSAVADGRVTIVDSSHALVQSSSRNKVYQIEWSPDFKKISSNDNASYWQGYLGYPIIAVLLALGKLGFDEATATMLIGVHWKALNDQYKRDYDKAVEHVLSELTTKGGDRLLIIQQVDNIMMQLQQLPLERMKPGKMPPTI